MYGSAPTTTRRFRRPDYPLSYFKFFAFLWSGGENPWLRRRETNFVLQGVPPAERRQNALQAKKRDIFPAGKVWFLPPRPRRYFRAAEIRYLAQKRDKYFDAFTRQIFPPFGFLYGSKNGTAKIFDLSKQPRGSVRTSFGCCSICLQKALACGNSRWGLKFLLSHFVLARSLRSALN